MKHIAAFFSVVGLVVLGASLHPGVEPMEAQAASAGGQSTVIKCSSTACQDGWDSAYIEAISEESECHSISTDREEIQGCVAFVQDSNQVRFLRDRADLDL